MSSIVYGILESQLVILIHGTLKFEVYHYARQSSQWFAQAGLAAFGKAMQLIYRSSNAENELSSHHTPPPVDDK